MNKLSKIYEKLSHEIVFSELEPKEKGNYFIMICPFCGEREFYIYKNSRTGHCNRKNQCGKSTTIWDYVKNNFSLQENKDVLKKLAELAGYKPGEDW